MSYIDIHHHVIGGKHPNAVNMPKWNMEIDFEETQKMGISGSLLSLPVSSTPEQTRAINNFIAEFKSYNSKHYGMLACLPSIDVDQTLNEIEYAYDQLGADGFIMPSNASGMYIGDDKMDKILAELDRRNSVVLIHPTKPGGDIPELLVKDHSVYEYPFDTTRAIMDLIYRGKIQQFPNIKWIASHAGGTIPYIAYRLSDVSEEVKASKMSRKEIIDAMKTIYYDLALSTSETVFFALKELVGSSKILFGTDYPLRYKNGVESSINIIQKSTILSEEDKKMIFSENAKQLFPRFEH